MSAPSNARLTILYRTHSGTNRKQRPAWFERSSALQSLREAVDQAGVEASVHFVVDGAMPDELRGLVRGGDVVAFIEGGSTARSFRSCVRYAANLARQNIDDDRIYWFAEDDYGYRPEAISQLMGAARAFSQAQYFTLYVPDEAPWHLDHPSQPFRPLSPNDYLSANVGAQEWRRVRETTSTFGVRASTLLQDQALLRAGSTVGAPFDAATWVALQGISPFSYRYIFSDLDGYWGARGTLKVVAKPVLRLGLNLVSQIGIRNPRVLVAPMQDLAMHLEAAMIPLDQDWSTHGRKSS